MPDPVEIKVDDEAITRVSDALRKTSDRIIDAAIHQIRHGRIHEPMSPRPLYRVIRRPMTPAEAAAEMEASEPQEPRHGRTGKRRTTRKARRKGR